MKQHPERVQMPRSNRPTHARALSGRGASGVIRQATSLLLRGARTRALKILRETMVRYPDDPAVLTRYGDTCYRSGDISKAQDAYRRALALDENLFQAWYGKGMADY
jgi:Flp pilus assembly protein TadD